MIILMCKFGLSRSGRCGSYLGFARTSWYGTTHIQITKKKRTSARRRYITGSGLRGWFGLRGKYGDADASVADKKEFTSMLIWRMK